MNIKKISYIVSALFILMGFMAVHVQNSFAQTPTPVGTTPKPVGSTPTAVATTSTPSSTVSFAMLGQTDVVMQGPLDIQSFSFNIPADWQLADGAQLHLNYSIFGGSYGTGANAAAPAASGYINVSLNSKPIGTIVAGQNGDGSVDFTIPALDWVTTDPTSPTKSLQFYLQTGIECRPTTNQINNEANLGQSVLVRSTSYFTLPYKVAPIATDLRMLPYPIYQDTFIPDKAVLVVPDNPSEAELQAAFTASAALGRLTNGKLSLDFTTTGKLTPAQLADSHVIYVGKASSFSQLTAYPWPAPFQGQSFSGPQLGADDGILQEIASPKDPSRVWLLVSGQSDAAVVKASEALGSGVIRVGSQPNFAVITNAQQLAAGYIQRDRSVVC